MKRLRAALLAAVLAACATADGAPAPREIRPGEDECAYCHMTADDPDRAAEWVEAGGRVHTFDEAGCLVAWLAKAPRGEGAGYVADARGSGWVPAEQAFFVRGPARAGMGFGVAAYRDAGEAGRAAAARGGRVQRWAELREEGVADAHAH